MMTLTKNERKQAYWESNVIRDGDVYHQEGAIWEN